MANRWQNVLAECYHLSSDTGMKSQNNSAANHKIILKLYSKRFSTSKHEIIAVLQFMYKV